MLLLRLETLHPLPIDPTYKPPQSFVVALTDEIGITPLADVKNERNRVRSIRLVPIFTHGDPELSHQSLLKVNYSSFFG